MSQIQKIKSVLIVLFSLFLLGSQVSCTSSDEEESAFESEMEAIENGDDDVGETLDGEIGGLDELNEDGLTDELDSELEDVQETSVADIEGEELETELGDDAISDDDLELADDDLESDVSDQIAEGEDFDDFDESDDDFSNFDDESAVAQSEEALKEELAQANPNSQMPVTENAQATFPEEVVAIDPTQNSGMIPPPNDLGMIDPNQQGGFPVVSSESNNQPAFSDFEPALPKDDLGMADPTSPIEESNNEVSWIPVVKVKTDPFFRNQRLMNAVYIARPKDNIEGISEKIYGSDRSSELRDDNPHLAKGLDPGDKVYYNSPNRPEDKGQLKIYYEDLGLKPQYYQTREGDNMRRLGSKLLGFPEGWKEVWAINQNIDSKTILPAGLEIRYWTGDEQPVQMPLAINENTQSVGGNNTPSHTDPMMAAGTTESFGAAEDLPPEPPLPEPQAAAIPAPEPEAIPDIEPFPEPGVVTTPVPVGANVTAVDPNQSLLTVGALALFILAGAALVAIQIKKRKDNTGMRPQSLEYTQV